MGMQMDTSIEGSTLPIDKLTKVFFKIKEKRETLKAAFDSEDRELEAKQTKIKAVLLDHLKDRKSVV